MSVLLYLCVMAKAKDVSGQLRELKYVGGSAGLIVVSWSRMCEDDHRSTLSVST